MSTKNPKMTAQEIMAQDEIPEIVTRKICSQCFLLPANYDNFICGPMFCPLQIDAVIYLNSLFDH